METEVVKKKKVVTRKKKATPAKAAKVAKETKPPKISTKAEFTNGDVLMGNGFLIFIESLKIQPKPKPVAVNCLHMKYEEKTGIVTSVKSVFSLKQLEAQILKGNLRLSGKVKDLFQFESFN